MRFARFGLFCLILVVFPAWSKRPHPPQQTQTATPTPAAKDPQAVSILNQALSVAGGIPAISAIADYTATGNMTYHSSQDMQGTVTLRGLGVGQFRMDVNLQNGVRSEVDSDTSTIKFENGMSRRYNVPMSPGRFSIPTLPFPVALTSAGLSLTYKGLVSINGRSAHEIEIQHRLPASISDPNGYFRDFHTVDYFIDASTFQVLMIQDVVAKKSVRQIWYSDYRLVGGILVPFSISEQLDGDSTWQIALGQMAFNSGLQESDFQL